MAKPHYSMYLALMQKEMGVSAEISVLAQSKGQALKVHVLGQLCGNHTHQPSPATSQAPGAKLGHNDRKADSQPSPSSTESRHDEVPCLKFSAVLDTSSP